MIVFERSLRHLLQHLVQETAHPGTGFHTQLKQVIPVDGQVLHRQAGLLGQHPLQQGCPFVHVGNGRLPGGRSVSVAASDAASLCGEGGVSDRTAKYTPLSV